MKQWFKDWLHPTEQDVWEDTTYWICWLMFNLVFFPLIPNYIGGSVPDNWYNSPPNPVAICIWVVYGIYVCWLLFEIIYVIIKLIKK